MRTKVYNTYTASSALILAVSMGILLSGMMILGNVYDKSQIIEFWPHILTNLTLNIILFYILFIYNFYISRHEWAPWKRYLWEIVGTLIITTIFMQIATLVRRWLNCEEEECIHIIKESLMAISVLLINGILYSLTRRQQIALEYESLRAEKLQIQYDALASKLDPHFLFNSLNTLSGLVPENEKAQEYIEQLADIYRYIMRDTKFVTLAEELKFTESYVYLMQIRYDNSLNIQWDIDKSTFDLYALPISLQLLVENAIKHNVASKLHPLNIKIFTTPNNTLKVENDIHPIADKPRGTGLGLTNLNKRYTMLMDNPINIIHTQQTFSVEIPLLTHNQISQIIKQLEQ